MLTNLAYGGNGASTYGDNITSGLTVVAGSNKPSATFDTGQIITGAGGTAYTTSVPSTTSGSGGQYGYLYNWCAAMGGTTKNNKACTKSNVAPTGYLTDVSVCPKNWRMPTNGELSSVYYSLGSTLSKMTTTWLGVYSGWYRGAVQSFEYQGTSGRYWSSTTLNAEYAHYTQFSGTTIYPGSNTYRSFNQAVRCVI
jgi:uncharacterized protein (TIGR02145 family)